MNKILKNFLRVLYFIAFFGIGILLAFVLPSMYTNNGIIDRIENSLKEGKYSQTYGVTDVYYLNDTEQMYTHTFPNNMKVVIAQGATLGTEKKDNKDVQVVRQVYSGYFYDVPTDFSHVKYENNQTKIVATSDEGTNYNYAILDYSSKEDGVNDSVGSLTTRRFIYFELKKGCLDNIKSIKLIDSVGSAYATITFDTSWTFDKPFFNDLNEFVEEYNKDSTQTEKLTKLQNDFLAKNSKYALGSDIKDIVNASRWKANWIIVGYFLLTYILFDLTLGPRYLVKLGILIYVSIKNLFKKKDPNEIIDPLGKDYCSQLTISLILPEGVNDDVVIKFKNSDYSYEVVLNVLNKYKACVSVHAGKYTGLSIASSKVELEEPIKEFVVKGYIMELSLKMKQKNLFLETVK